MGRTSLEQAREVKRRHGEFLKTLPGVIGVGVTKKTMAHSDNVEWVVKLMVAPAVSRAPSWRASIPDKIDGVVITIEAMTLPWAREKSDNSYGKFEKERE